MVAVAAPLRLCDWCRAHTSAPDALAAHEAECPERLAFALRPESAPLRPYWVLLAGGFASDLSMIHVTRILARPQPWPLHGRSSNANWDARHFYEKGTVVLFTPVKRDHLPDWEYEPLGRLDDGTLFNTLERARAVGLKRVADRIAIAEEARRRLEAPPTVRKYPSRFTQAVLP